MENRNPVASFEARSILLRKAGEIENRNWEFDGGTFSDVPFLIYEETSSWARGRRVREGGPVGCGTVDIEADGERAIGARIAVGDTRVAREGAANGTELELLVVTERILGEDESAVEGDVNSLSELERPVVRVRELDENSDLRRASVRLERTSGDMGAHPQVNLLEVYGRLGANVEMLVPCFVGRQWYFQEMSGGSK